MLWLFDHLQSLHLAGCTVDALQSDMHSVNLGVFKGLEAACRMMTADNEFAKAMHAAHGRELPSEQCTLCECIHLAMDTSLDESEPDLKESREFFFNNPWRLGRKIYMLPDSEHALRAARNAIFATRSNRDDAKQRHIELEVIHEGVQRTLPVSWDHIKQTAQFDLQTNGSASVARIRADAVELKGSDR